VEILFEVFTEKRLKWKAGLAPKKINLPERISFLCISCLQAAVNVFYSRLPTIRGNFYCIGSNIL